MAKLNANERKEFLLSRLEEQRHLLMKSIEAMAAGDLVEALRVATSIRVLVHETGSSKPLLKQLTPSYLELPILDRIEEQPSKNQVVFYCPISARLSSDGKVGLITGLDSPRYALSKLGAWWYGACMHLPGVGPVARRELILGLANKEGGAHVDPDITRRYKQLLESKFVSAKLGDADVGPLNVSRLVAGRAGVELLDCLERNFPRKA